MYDVHTPLTHYRSSLSPDQGHTLSMSLKLRGPDGHQKLVVHTDQVLGSSVGGKVVKAKLDKYPCTAKFFDWSHYSCGTGVRELSRPTSSKYCPVSG